MDEPKKKHTLRNVAMVVFIVALVGVYIDKGKTKPTKSSSHIQTSAEYKVQKKYEDMCDKTVADTIVRLSDAGLKKSDTGDYIQPNKYRCFFWVYSGKDSGYTVNVRLEQTEGANMFTSKVNVF